MVRKADPATFQILEGPFSKDKNYVYVTGEIFEKADVKTFQTLGDYGYAKDKRYVYRYNKILEGEKPADFLPPPQPVIMY